MATYKADPRHAEILRKELGLENCKPVASPSSKVETEEDEEELSEDYSTRFRSLVARANYLALDRPDIQYACKELSSYMSKPSVSDWERLRRLGKYLRGRPRRVHRYWKMDKSVSLNVYTDANWASNKKYRKSTSGGCMHDDRCSLDDKVLEQNAESYRIIISSVGAVHFCKGNSRSAGPPINGPRHEHGGTNPHTRRCICRSGHHLKARTGQSASSGYQPPLDTHIKKSVVRKTQPM